MHEIPILLDLVILLSFSLLVVLLLQRLKLPSILGFLISGIIIGPYGLSLVGAVDQVEVLAEIGVILLLFVIGMELSIKQLISIRRTVFFGGSLQVGLTAIIAMGFYKLAGFSWNESVFVGFLFSLSSTAIVLKFLQDRNEITAPHGRNALGILIFQDIIVVPMMLVTPILAGQSANISKDIVELLVKSGIIIAITYISARFLVDRLMHYIAKSKSKELFLLATIAICFAVAYLTSFAGLSLALGAFLAGLIISESEYSHQATSTILPFRELFTSIFFISVGMLLDLSFFIDHIGIILLLVVIVFFVKSFIAGLAVAILKYPPRTVILTGLALFQVGEFAFILSKVGIENDLLSPIMNQYFLSVSIITMLMTPFVIMQGERISNFLINKRLKKKWSGMLDLDKANALRDDSGLENHIIIIGYGINGTNVAKAARYADIPYIIVELDADRVKHAKLDGEPIIFGDATHEHILESLEIHSARVVVIAISDPIATKHILTHIRSESQSIYVIVRTRYVKETNELLGLGADEVIPEEFETSIEIFSRVLHNFLVPLDEIDNIILSIRSDNYKMFQSQTDFPKTLRASQIPDLQVTCVRLKADSGDIVGKTLDEADIRQEYGVNVLAILRGDDMIEELSPDVKLHQHDRIFVIGSQSNVDRFYKAVN
jgi:monovalent cation:H+ antiporter-2, CPA2 family